MTELSTARMPYWSNSHYLQ